MFVVSTSNAKSKFQSVEKLIQRRQQSVQNSREDSAKVNEARNRLDDLKAQYHEVAFYDALKHLKIDFKETPS
jgi:hypothetical protein